MIVLLFMHPKSGKGMSTKLMPYIRLSLWDFCGPEGRVDSHSGGPGGRSLPGAEPEQAEYRQLFI